MSERVETAPAEGRNAANAAYMRRGALTLVAVALGGYLTDYVFNLGLTRFLSPHSYGDFKVARQFAMFFGLAVLLGGDRAAPMVLAPILERRAPRQAWEYLRFYLGNALVLSAGLATVTWTASYLYVRSTDPLDHHPLAWVVPAIPLYAAAAMASRTLQSARRLAMATVPWRIGLPALSLGFLALAVAIHGHIGLEEAVLISVLAALVMTFIQWLWVRRLGLVEIAREPGFQEARSWLRASLPMMGTLLVALALNQSDLYFLEALGDEAEVGHYAAAATTAHFLLIIQTTLVGLIAPIARPAIDRGEASSKATFWQSQRLMLSLLVPVALVLAAAGGPILGLFGTGYRSAHTVLEYLVLGNLTWALAAVPSLWMQYQNRAHVVLGVSISTLVVDSLLNFLLIPRYGMAGAAAGTAATLTSAAVAVAILSKTRRTLADPPEGEPAASP